MIYILATFHSLRKHKQHAIFILELTPDRLVQVFGEVSDVLGIQACHGYPTIRGEVDVGLLSQGLALFGVDTSETIK